MKFTLSWLKQHLQTSASVEKLASLLTSLGVEVEHIEDTREAFAGISVAQILQANKHPHADRLKVCQVQTGQGVVSLVCGAENAREGLMTAFIAPGYKVPQNGQVLKKACIRGIESYGMLCSEAELCLSPHSDGNIIELDPRLEVGTFLPDALGMNDILFTVSVTPNRSDLLYVRGIARDLAAAGLGTLSQNIYSIHSSMAPCSVEVSIDAGAKEACPWFTGRIIEGVVNRESPSWLQGKLKSIGLKPVSALVDITNYVLFDIGRPLHVFDAEKINGHLQVRFAKPGEKLLALNHKEYALQNDMLVIADNEKPLSIAGIMGGVDSGCTQSTTRVFLESAYFLPDPIMQAGRQLNIQSDSRYRFERGVDPSKVIKGLNMATQLILEICGGHPTAIVTAGGEPQEPRPIRINREKIRQYTGLDIPSAPLILEKLGFQADKAQSLVWHQHASTLQNSAASSDSLEVTPPAWRHDIHLEVDLIEEVLRIYGYDRILEERLPYHSVAPSAYAKEAVARRILARQGLLEAVSWSFLEEEAAKIFGLTDFRLKLVNPISMDMAVMRPSLLPQLLLASQRNMDRGQSQVGLFEVGFVYHGLSPSDQIPMVASIRAGFSFPDHWSCAGQDVDIFDIKGDLWALIEGLGINLASLKLSTDSLKPWYHPHRSAVVLSPQDQCIGYFGQIHPAVQKKLGLKKDHVAFELYLDSLPGIQVKSPCAPLVIYPLMPVERDFAFIVDGKMPAQQMIKAVKQADKHITQVKIFDIFQGEGVPDAHKSVALRVTLQPIKATFTDADIQSICACVIQNVEKRCQGKLRR